MEDIKNVSDDLGKSMESKPDPIKDGETKVIDNKLHVWDEDLETWVLKKK